jgi:hypothetical protein
MLIGGTSPTLADRRPELLGLEGFISHLGEQNEDFKFACNQKKSCSEERSDLLVAVGRKISRLRMWNAEFELQNAFPLSCDVSY